MVIIGIRQQGGVPIDESSPLSDCLLQCCILPQLQTARFSCSAACYYRSLDLNMPAEQGSKAEEPLSRWKIRRMIRIIYSHRLIVVCGR